MLQKQIVPVKPVATVNAGGVWESINGGLSDALGLWAQVEQIKGQRSASGQDQNTAMYRPELANGAAVQLDQNLTPKKDDGFKFDKPLMYVSLGLLGLAFVMRMKGFS